MLMHIGWMRRRDSLGSRSQACAVTRTTQEEIAKVWKKQIPRSQFNPRKQRVEPSVARDDNSCAGLGTEKPHPQFF
jgi:hypothetical protein